MLAANHKARTKRDAFYDGDGLASLTTDQIIAECDGSNNLVRKFIYGSGIDEPVMMINVDGQNETKYYYHYDALGSVIALSNAGKQIVEQYSYDVFGTPNTTSGVGNPYMFTGRQWDADAHTYYYRARFYSPTLGRFIQPDPIGYEDGLNLYTYCKNNPINFTDPTGRYAVVVAAPVVFDAMLITGGAYIAYKAGADIRREGRKLDFHGGPKPGPKSWKVAIPLTIAYFLSQILPPAVPEPPTPPTPPPPDDAGPPCDDGGNDSNLWWDTAL